jgi:hypothetical protein
MIHPFQMIAATRMAMAKGPHCSLLSQVACQLQGRSWARS